MPAKLEVQLVRETLEGALAPAQATAVLFEALDRSGGVPEDASSMLTMVREVLADVLEERVGAQVREQVVEELETRLKRLTGAQSIDTDLDALLIEVDEEPPPVPRPRIDDPGKTVQMVAVARPVTVLVCSGTAAFADHLIASLGTERVYPLTLKDERELRHATFSRNPLFVVVDASTPPPMAPESVAAVLRGLPHRVVPVVWDTTTAFGHAVRDCVPDLDRCLHLDRHEGVEPLHDLVLSRFVAL